MSCCPYFDAVRCRGPLIKNSFVFSLLLLARARAIQVSTKEQGHTDKSAHTSNCLIFGILFCSKHTATATRNKCVSRTHVSDLCIDSDILSPSFCGKGILSTCFLFGRSSRIQLSTSINGGTLWSRSGLYSC